MCSFQADLLKSLKSFDFGDELGHILDRYVAPLINGTIFAGDMAVITEVKSFVLDEAKTKANQIKSSIANLIEGFPCDRRLDEVDISYDGSQRMMHVDQTLGSLVDQILDFNGVQSVAAGFDLVRMEVGLDVTIRVEEAFGVSSFQSALNSVFDKLAPLQAVFGASGVVPAVDDLLSELDITAAFWLSISAGAKVNASLTDVFDSISTGNAPPVTVFLRIDQLGASVYAQVTELNLDLFPGIIDITDASLELGIGLGLSDPYEFILDSANSQIGIGFNELVTGMLRFKPFGSLAASFPFSISVGSIQQDLELLFDDNNLFDEKEVSVTVNFNACRFLAVFQQMLGKLGSIGLSPDIILGPNAVSGIGLESLNSLFPDLGRFLTGVLEGE